MGAVGCSFAGRSVIADAMAAAETATAASHCYCMHWQVRLAASADIAVAIISLRTSIVKMATSIAAAKYPSTAVGRRLQHRGCYCSRVPCRCPFESWKIPGITAYCIHFARIFASRARERPDRPSAPAKKALTTATAAAGERLSAMVASMKSTCPFNQALAALSIAFVAEVVVGRTKLRFASRSRSPVCLSSRAPFVTGTFPFWTF